MIPVELVDVLLHNPHEIASGTSISDVNFREGRHSFDFPLMEYVEPLGSFLGESVESAMTYRSMNFSVAIGGGE
jgi:hypothetical protein